ncbi:MAG TPA: hypothetical protein VK925_06885 [Jiangellaceae bacterium]|nr:hypothetical protein [Jiangellaceae bacterium]
MSDRDGVPRTTEAERQRAQAVHSMDDVTRMHAGGDETDLAQGAGGDLYRPAAGDRGGDVLGDEAQDDTADVDERTEQDMAGGGRVDSPDAADADLAQEGRESS